MDQPTKIKIGPKQHLGDIEWQRMSNRLKTLITIGMEEKYKIEYIDYIAWENQLRKTPSTLSKIVFKYCKISMLNLERTKPSSPTLQEIYFNQCEFEKNSYLTGCPKLGKICFKDCKGTIILKNLAFRELIFAEDADAFCADISTAKVNAIFIQGIELSGQERYQLTRLQRQFTWEQYQEHLLNSMMLSERTETIRMTQTNIQNNERKSNQHKKINSQKSALSLISLMHDDSSKQNTLKQSKVQTIQTWDDEVTSRAKDELLLRANYKNFGIQDLYKSLHSEEGLRSYLTSSIQTNWKPEVSKYNHL